MHNPIGVKTSKQANPSTVLILFDLFICRQWQSSQKLLIGILEFQIKK